MGQFDYFERPPVPEPDCGGCEDRGFVWRVPDGFNPFSAGAFRTAAVAQKTPCPDCERGRRYGRPSQPAGDA